MALNTLCHCLCVTKTSTLAYYFRFRSVFFLPASLDILFFYGDGHTNHDKRFKKRECRMSTASKSLPHPPEYHYSEEIHLWGGEATIERSFCFISVFSGSWRHAHFCKAVTRGLYPDGHTDCTTNTSFRSRGQLDQRLENYCSALFSTCGTWSFPAHTADPDPSRRFIWLLSELGVHGESAFSGTGVMHTPLSSHRNCAKGIFTDEDICDER